MQCRAALIGRETILFFLERSCSVVQCRAVSCSHPTKFLHDTARHKNALCTTLHDTRLHDNYGCTTAARQLNPDKKNKNVSTTFHARSTRNVYFRCTTGTFIVFFDEYSRGMSHMLHSCVQCTYFTVGQTCTTPRWNHVRGDWLVCDQPYVSITIPSLHPALPTCPPPIINSEHKKQQTQHRNVAMRTLR